MVLLGVWLAYGILEKSDLFGGFHPNPLFPWLLLASRRERSYYSPIFMRLLIYREKIPCGPILG
jgi:hypothetical protein